MKYGLFTIAALLTCYTACAGGTAGDLMLTNMHGRIKSITELHYDVTSASESDNGIEKTVLSHMYYYNFDTLGHITEEKSLFGKIKCTYNSKGRRIKEYTEKNKAWIKTCVYVYDTKGRILRDTSYAYATGIADYITVYKYDAKGNKIEEAYYSTEGTSPRKELRKYDDNNRCTEIKILNDAGEVESKTLYKYNAEGLKEEKKEFKGESTLESTTLYTYDTKGNNTELREYDPKGVLNESYHLLNKYQYDDKGNWIRKDYDGRGHVMVIIREIAYY